jgi:2-keto-3-deoxy-L-rhamnonate aldolase RhmA
VQHAKFRNGARGFSNSARFGRYGTTTISEAIAIGDLTQVICQIESAEAVENADSIASTEGVAGLLIGRADLALSLGVTDLKADVVVTGTRRAIAAARQHQKTAAVVLGAVEEMPNFLSQGVTMFIFGSDQSILRNGAAAMFKQCAHSIQSYRQLSTGEMQS